MARMLRHWLTLSLSLLVAAPVLIVTVFLLIVLMPQLQAHVEAENRAFNDAISAQVDLYLVASADSIERLGRDIADLPAAGLNLQHRLDTLATTAAAIDAVYLLDGDDRVAQVGLTPARRPSREDFFGLDFSARAYVRAARHSGALTWSDTYLSPKGEIAVAVAVPNKGRLLVGEMDLRQLSEFVRALGKSKNLMAVMIDRQGQIVAHPDASLSLQQHSLGTNPLIREAVAGRAASGTIEMQGTDYIGTVTPVSGLGWAVLVAQPAAVAFAAQRTVLLVLAAGTIFSLLSALAFALLSARAVSRQIRDFSALMHGIATGDYHTPIPAYRVTELNDLAANMRRMAGAVLERELRLQLAASVFSASAEGILITGRDMRIISANPALLTITGYELHEVIGKTPAMFKSGRHDRGFYRSMMNELAASGLWRGEIWNRRKNGEIYPEWLTITAVKDAGGAIVNYIGSFFDISERKDAEEHIRFLANHDPLTRLPNRTLLDDRLRQALVASRRKETRAAILLLDLDRFKLINDTLGHETGDRLLEIVARRLSGSLRETETVARLGGDEFIIVSPEVHSLEQVTALAQRVLAIVAEPHLIDAQEMHVTPSIGISIFPDDGEDASTLLRNADAAMYHAKDVGRNNFQFFTPSMNFVMQERMAIENDLHRALQNSEFELYYQPQVDSRTGAVFGMEALLRWRHPQRGLTGPDKFIPIAEETGLIVPIGEWVLHEACRQGKAWHDLGQAGLRIGVNLSARQFEQPDLYRQIANALDQSGLRPDCLELEITEGMLMGDPEAAAELLRALSDLGVRLAIDDFGTGYSSLAYLKRFPVNRLKIDKSFVRDISSDSNDAAIVSAVIGLAASLNLAVIAEGVESLEQLRYLEQNGCCQLQGYFFSRPLPASHFTSFRYEVPHAVDGPA